MPRPPKDIDPGQASDYTGDIEVALSFEGLKQRQTLAEAGYKTLREWVDHQIADISAGRRKPPELFKKS